MRVNFVAKAVYVRISAAIFVCAVLLAVCSAGAQSAPSEPNAPAAPGKPVAVTPCGVLSKTLPANDGILTDTGGVDLRPYLRRVYRIVQSSWQPLIPKEVSAPVNKSGEVMICFKLLPNGRLMEKSMVLEGRSGDEALDRAAWGAILTSIFPPLPDEFKKPYVEVRFHFMYNQDQKAAKGTRRLPRPIQLGLTAGYGAKL